jgi:tripartite-type tricarboxylate transporter receptor subunit TctC
VKTPAPVVERLRADLRRVLDDQPTRKRLLGTGSEVGGLIGDDFRARVESDVGRWRTLADKVKLG